MIFFFKEAYKPMIIKEKIFRATLLRACEAIRKNEEDRNVSFVAMNPSQFAIKCLPLSPSCKKKKRTK